MPNTICSTWDGVIPMKEKNLSKGKSDLYLKSLILVHKSC